MSEKQVVVRLQDVRKSYFMMGGLTQLVLKGISFEVKSGEFVAIMGHSGSGKSTLMNILGCLDRPTAGQYWLDGQDVSQQSDDELARVRNKTLGFVFQNFNLLTKRTIVDNVALPLLYQGVGVAECKKRALEMLDSVKLHGYENYLPSQLSGGMQQRVAVARALINDPTLILADEPTGNLDTQTSNEIMDLFCELNRKGITIILVTHEPDIARYAKRLVRIADGLVEYDGDVKEDMEIK
ncbi:MAG: ABC transporter ATP-binding protein [Alphaproteobacteria bacterium]|nr:ABC transporter ATP-binding protein [Alphaproteobacteria bacterium]